MYITLEVENNTNKLSLTSKEKEEKEGVQVNVFDTHHFIQPLFYPY